MKQLFYKLVYKIYPYGIESIPWLYILFNYTNHKTWFALAYTAELLYVCKNSGLMTIFFFNPRGYIFPQQ